MKKALSVILSIALLLSLAACGNSATPAASQESMPAQSSEAPSAVEAEPTPEPTEEPTEEPKAAKEDLLSSASPMTREDLEKSIDNAAFAKSLIGNVFTFDGEIDAVEDDHAVITFYISDENGAYATSDTVMVGNLYLPLKELISLETKQRLSFVGALDDVGTHDVSIPDWGTVQVVDMNFQSCAIVGDRFEATGTLYSQNAGYGDDAWNVLPPGSNSAYVVHFREDVSSYKGKEITFSYQINGDGCVDAYIVE